MRTLHSLSQLNTVGKKNHHTITLRSVSVKLLKNKRTAKLDPAHLLGKMVVSLSFFNRNYKNHETRSRMQKSATKKLSYFLFSLIFKMCQVVSEHNVYPACTFPNIQTFTFSLPHHFLLMCLSQVRSSFVYLSYWGLWYGLHGSQPLPIFNLSDRKSIFFRYQTCIFLSL